MAFGEIERSNLILRSRAKRGVSKDGQQRCTRLEGYVGVYEPAWGTCSPGNVLTEHVLHWAFERRLDVDFRIGDQPYEEKWNGRSIDVATWHVATSPRGLPVVLRRRMGWLLRRLGLRR